MKTTFRDCLEKRRIFRSDFVHKLVGNELADAEEDLNMAHTVLDNNGFKWATIQSYYSMFHAARALVYAKGYGEKGHYCLLVALEELYVKERIIEQIYSDSFLNAMMLRENADYKRTFSEESARVIIKSAEQFLQKAKKILKPCC